MSNPLRRTDAEILGFDDAVDAHLERVGVPSHWQYVERYIAAVRRHRHLVFMKPVEKERAIQRILNSNPPGLMVPEAGWSRATSVTAAEKLVEAEDQYAAFHRDLVNAEIEEIVAKELMLFHRGPKE